MSAKNTSPAKADAAKAEAAAEAAVLAAAKPTLNVKIPKAQPPPTTYTADDHFTRLRSVLAITKPCQWPRVFKLACDNPKSPAYSHNLWLKYCGNKADYYESIFSDFQRVILSFSTMDGYSSNHLEKRVTLGRNTLTANELAIFLWRAYSQDNTCFAPKHFGVKD